MVAYHDDEWGRPRHEDRVLFEFLVLEGAQAGLSWMTILRKRRRYHEAFCQFEPKKVARLTGRDVGRLMKDPGIVRNRAKIEAAIGNARAVLEIQKEFASLSRYLWEFVGGRPLLRRPRSLRDVPATTPESDAMSKALRERGLRFVGPTICYAFMQACGLVNDHVRGCFLAAR
jgi:DNA-3-methyladenine glycosylase I